MLTCAWLTGGGRSVDRGTPAHCRLATLRHRNTKNVYAETRTYTRPFLPPSQSLCIPLMYLRVYFIFVFECMYTITYVCMSVCLCTCVVGCLHLSVSACGRPFCLCVCVHVFIKHNTIMLITSLVTKVSISLSYFSHSQDTVRVSQVIEGTGGYLSAGGQATDTQVNTTSCPCRRQTVVVTPTHCPVILDRRGPRYEARRSCPGTDGERKRPI